MKHQGEARTSLFSLRIQPVLRHEDGGTGDRWIACLDIKESPAYDGSGATIEEALAALVLQMAEALANA